MPANPLRTVAAALVAALQANGFVEAERRPLPYLNREDCASRRCVVILRNGSYPDAVRDGFDHVAELSVVIQKGVDKIHDNATVDALVDDVGELVALWGEDGELKDVDIGGATHMEGPEHPTQSLYEPELLNQHKLFTSITVVRYGLLA